MVRFEAVARGRRRRGAAGLAAAVAVALSSCTTGPDAALDTDPGPVRTEVAQIVRAVEVPGSGHWLPAENPGSVTAELLRFLGA